MAAPRGLGNRGRALWRSIEGNLPEGWEFDDREAALLRLACEQSDDLARLEEAVRKHGAMVAGSTGQRVVNPALVEARQARLVISRLLGQLSLPDEDDQPKTDAGRRGQRAAQARWSRRDQLAEQRRKVAERGA